MEKYGQIRGAFSVSISGSVSVGVTYEFGWVATNKNYAQYYQTIYYSHGLGASATSNGILIKANKGYKPTFSDWKGGYYSAGASSQYLSGAIGGTPGCTTFSIGLGVGYTFGFQNNKTYSVNVGKTALIGTPIYIGGTGSLMTNKYIRSCGQP